MTKDFSLISDKQNTYFKNRKICIGSSIPASGDYMSGDIIIKENPVAEESIGWICVTGGSPGEWTEILGGGGNTQIEIPDKSITEAKLDEAIVNKINKVDDIGDKVQLKTNNKNDLVSAINEVFQSGNNAKQGLVDALIAKGMEASTSETWDVLNNMVRNISIGKKFAMGTCNRQDLIREYDGIYQYWDWYILETSLDFLPSIIIVTPNKVDGISSISIYTDNISIFGGNGNGQWDMTIVPKNFNGTAYYNNGFKAFVYRDSSMIAEQLPDYTWFAFE